MEGREERGRREGGRKGGSDGMGGKGVEGWKEGGGKEGMKEIRRKKVKKKRKEEIIRLRCCKQTQPQLYTLWPGLNGSLTEGSPISQIPLSYREKRIQLRSSKHFLQKSTHPQHVATDKTLLLSGES